NFVRLQQDAAAFLESSLPGRRVASMWPFTDAVERPEMGYVEHSMRAVEANSFAAASIASLDSRDYDVVVVYTRTWPLQGLLDTPWIRAMLRRYANYETEPGSDQLRNALDLVPVAMYVRQGQRVVIYGKAVDQR